MISKLKYEYLLFFIAVAWALFFSFSLQLQPYYSAIGDDATYLAAAKLLYFDATLDASRPVLIAAIFGLPFLFGCTASVVIKWVFVLNFLTWFFTGILVFKIGAAQFNKKIAFVIAVVFLLSVGNLAHAFRVLSESVFIFMLVLALYFIHNYFLTRKPEFITLAVSILLFNTLIKPVAIGFTLLLLLFFIREMKSIFINKFSPVMLAGLLLVFFQMYSLKKTYGDFTLSYIGSITYYNYLGTKADCYRKNIEFVPGKSERTKAFNKVPISGIKETASKDLSEQLQNNTVNLGKAYLFCMYSNISKGNYIVSECKNDNDTFYFGFFKFLFKVVSKLQNIIFTGTGIIMSFYFLIKFKTQQHFFVILSLFLLYLFFISAMSCYECDRFHIVLYPIILLMYAHFYQNKIHND